MSGQKKYIVALDQGTTSSRAIIFDQKVNIIGSAQQEFTQYYPVKGWVEHNPMEIWATQSAVLTEVLAKTGVLSHEVAAIGVANQRETIVVWDKKTGIPVYNAIVWQCRRTAERCKQIKEDGLAPYIIENTGLVVDPYFSGTKIEWILDNVEGAREKANKGHLLFGTIDTWLLWKMTYGRVHVTDYTNASRTMLFNIHTLEWDKNLIDYLNIPVSMFPEVKPSSSIYGRTNIGGKGGTRILVAGVAGDQQAALFGQLCIREGMIKNTYGTGCFMLMNTGKKAIKSNNGLLTTLAVGATGDVSYALEGSVFMGGAIIQWLRDELCIIQNAADSGYFATQVKDTGGVYLVPAFVGLGAPYWNPEAKGIITGMTRGTNRNHIIRAALESIAYQSRDLIEAMQKDAKMQPDLLTVDGGATSNDFLMQFQADILGACILRPKIAESTALGAAFLAGLAVGFWKNTEQLESLTKTKKQFIPQLSESYRESLYEGWKYAVRKSII